MRKMLMSAGLALATLTAGVASAPAAHAQSGCERHKHNDRVTGTVLGGIVGALAGSAIGHSTAGTLVGAGVGAVGGNVIAGQQTGPCGPDYYGRGYSRSRYDRRYRHARRYDDRAAYDERQAYSSSAYAGAGRCGWQDQAYRDAYGNVVHRQVQVCR